ncbi:hypothetical protein B0H13DRAFT_2273923 [Mycena leptocephala]|nr:hypothetical protein B0H13DRAFT_2273923 [Mycena leptocephala]
MARSNKPTPTVSTYSKRNPARAVQPARKRSKKSGNASKATDALKTAQRLRDRINMDTDVSAFYDYKDMLVKTLATKYNRTVTHFRKLLSNGTQYSTTRGVSLWNAIIHDLSLKAKEAGDSSDLKTIRANFSKEDYEEMKETLSDEEEKRLRKQLREHRELKQRGICSTNRAAAADAMQNANRVGDVLMDLYERTGVRSIALFTHGHPDDPSVPHVVDSDETRTFFQEALGVSVLDVLRLLEQWSCTRDKATKNDRDTVQKEVAELLSAGLCKIKNKKAVAMVYTNYQEEIVHKLGVELAGWPTEVKIQRPSKMPAEHARSIRDKLRAGAICWVPLTRGQRDKVAAEMDALRAKGGLKKRKQRSDKGTVRGSRGDGEDDESDDEEEDETDGDEETDKEDDSDDEEGGRNPPTSNGDANSAAGPTDTSLVRAASSAPAPTETIVARVMATLLPADNTLQDPAFSSALPAFDFDNINWDLMLPPPPSTGPTAASAAPRPTCMPPTSRLPRSSRSPTAACRRMHSLPYRSEGGGTDDEFPLALSTVVTGGLSSATGGAAGASTTVFSVSTNLGDSGRKRKAGEDAEGARGPKKARKEGSDTGTAHPSSDNNDDGSGGGENAASSTATKQRKKRSDAGKPRGGSTNTAMAATSASTASTKQPRKKRSDAGVKRGPRN